MTTNRAVSSAICSLLLALGAAPALAGQSPAPDSATRVEEVNVAPGEWLHVESTGSGDVVVVVPGLFDAAFGYRKVIGPLVRAGYRVVVVEPLGVGASARPRTADYSLEAQAARIGAVLDSLHISRATFLARSVGASMVFRLTLARPSLVRGIVSIEGGITETAGTAGLRRGLSLASLLGHLGLKGVVMSRLKGRFKDSSGDPSWISDSTLAGYLEPLRDHYQQALAAYRAMAAAPESKPLAPRLKGIHCPVVLLVGGSHHEGGVGPQQIARMRADLPDFRVVDVPGAGSWIEEERPAVVVAAVEHMLEG